MTQPAEVTEWLREQGFEEVVSHSPVAGGCINNGLRLSTKTGHSFFLKQNQQAPDDMFLREAEGLEALNAAGGPRVPAVLLVGKSFLLLEDLSPASPQSKYWQQFGRQLARLHQHHHDRHGFHHDNYIGSTPQPNEWTDDGFQFFADHRLRFQAKLAAKNSLLSRSDQERVNELCRRLPNLVPEQPASLIHGDLWSGNAIAGPQGEPAIIDPATYFGWAEAELGMTKLFGGFPERFYDAYHEEYPLRQGWRERLPIYNLYHLLNHLNLFGRSYLAQVQSILSRFTSST